MGIKLEVQIQSGSDIGGISPFIVVGLDKHLKPELYKTAAAPGGGPSSSSQVVWNETFNLDLTTAMKNVIADGHPEPTYITFNIFDAGVQGFPSLGSAGVLLDTIKANGNAEGEFPVVNGTGSIALSVGPPNNKRSWVTSDNAKKAGIAGAVGVGIVAAGLTARHFINKKKEKDGSTKQSNQVQAAYSGASGGPPTGYPGSSGR